MRVNFRVECDVEMLLVDRIFVRDFGLTDFRSAESELLNYRQEALGQLPCQRSKLDPSFPAFQ
jgi:hypothetical protein